MEYDRSTTLPSSSIPSVAYWPGLKAMGRSGRTRMDHKSSVWSLRKMIVAFWNLSADAVMRSELAPFNQFRDLEHTTPQSAWEADCGGLAPSAWMDSPPVQNLRTPGVGQL